MFSPSDLPSLVTLRPWVERFSGVELVVWGDLVADRFLRGSTTRVSREAPALVLRHEAEETRPGAAGNAAMNAAALGARVKVAGYLGRDRAGEELRASLEAANIDTSGIVERDDGPTPIKTRVMAGGHHTARQQILRIDQDPSWPCEELQRKALETSLLTALEGSSAVLVSDYGLGTADRSTFDTLLSAARTASRPVTLDSRQSLLRFPGVTIATPNETEVEEALKIGLNGDLLAIESAGEALMSRLQSDAVVITRGSCGMVVFEREHGTVHMPIHGGDQIADVTGAGDTVIATLTLALAAGAETVPAACLANIAAGLVVMKHGTATVPHPELAAELLPS